MTTEREALGKGDAAAALKLCPDARSHGAGRHDDPRYVCWYCEAAIASFARVRAEAVRRRDEAIQVLMSHIRGKCMCCMGDEQFACEDAARQTIDALDD